MDVDFVQGTFYDVEVRFAHKIGPHKLRLLWESDTRDLEVIPSTHLFNQLCSSSTPFILQVVPDITNATTSGLANQVDYKNAIVGVKETHTILARDKYGNLQNHKLDVFKVTLVQVATGSLQTVSGPIAANADIGEYKIEYILMEVGDYKMDISVQFNGQGSTYALSTSPFYIRCHATTTDPSKTILTGAGTTNAVAGAVGTFLVTVFDAGNNQQQIGGDKIEVTIVRPSLTITEIEIFDNEDGTYRVEYKVTEATVDPMIPYVITVTVNGDSANSKTSYLTVVPNKPDPLKSTLLANTPLTIEQSHTFQVQIFDSYKNPIQVFVPVLAHLIGSG